MRFFMLTSRTMLIVCVTAFTKPVWSLPVRDSGIHAGGIDLEASEQGRRVSKARPDLLGNNNCKRYCRGMHCAAQETAILKYGFVLNKTSVSSTLKVNIRGLLVYALDRLLSNQSCRYSIDPW